MLQYAELQKEWWEKHWSEAKPENIDDAQTRRQVQFLKSLGVAVLPAEELSRVSESLLGTGFTNMAGTFSFRYKFSGDYEAHNVPH